MGGATGGPGLLLLPLDATAAATTPPMPPLGGEAAAAGTSHGATATAGPAREGALAATPVGTGAAITP